MGSMPFTGLILPSRESSPRSTALPISAEPISPVDFTRATAIARSSIAPSFLSSAGARLTVILWFGNFLPLFLIAERTLSRLSFTAASGSPTTSNACNPGFTSTSTSTGTPSNPDITNATSFASIISPVSNGDIAVSKHIFAFILYTNFLRL